MKKRNAALIGLIAVTMIMTGVSGCGNTDEEITQPKTEKITTGTTFDAVSDALKSPLEDESSDSAETPEETTKENSAENITEESAVTENVTTETTAAENTEEKTEAPQDTRSDYEIACSMINQPMSELIELIGEASYVDHASSCLVPGENDGYYEYADFAVATLSQNGVDYVYSVEAF